MKEIMATDPWAAPESPETRDMCMAHTFEVTATHNLNKGCCPRIKGMAEWLG